MNHKKTKITLIVFSAITTTTIISSTLTSCAKSYQFVFGNFQSYINPEVAKRIQNYIPNINWQYYNSNDQILTYLINKTFNTTIATNNMIAKLADKKLIKKIDWSKFEILTSDKSTIVKSGNDFKGIVSDIVYRIATEGFREFNVNLLDYCFPYFAQDYVFVYRGKEIKELSGDNVTFSDIFKVLNTDPRFFVKKRLPQVMMIKDSRTTFDLAKILQQEENNLVSPDLIDINPDTGLYNDSKQNSFSIDQFNNVYSQINHCITNKDLLINLNSDSNVLINKIVLNEINGAFMYNGDAVFAGIGGDYAGSVYNNRYIEYPTADDFHIVKPRNTLYCIDGVVLNSENDTEQLNTSLKLSYDLCMSGVNVKNFNDWNKNIESNTNINLVPNDLDIETEVNGEYLFLAMQNFDYVNYTPSLNKIYNLVSDPDSVYFKDVLAGLWHNESAYDSLDITQKQKIDLLANQLAKTIRIELPTNIDIAKHVELPLNNLTESNMTVAFTTFINELQG